MQACFESETSRLVPPPHTSACSHVCDSLSNIKTIYILIILPVVPLSRIPLENNVYHNLCLNLDYITASINFRCRGIELVCLRDRSHVVQVDLDLI